ncbi:hypothetical protein GVAV_002411 [Gurleya vavrai]
MNTTSFDKDEYNEFNPQELESLTEEKRLYYLTVAIKKFSENLYHSSILAKHCNEIEINRTDFFLGDILHMDGYEKWISLLIQEHLRNKRLLYYQKSVDNITDFLDKGINCQSKNHKNYFDIIKVQKIAEAHFIKYSYELQYFFKTFECLAKLNFLRGDFIILIQFMIENEFYKILIPDQYKNYCISCIYDHLNEKKIEPV